MKLTLPPAVKLRGGIIASRLGYAALVALVSLLHEHGLPRDTRTLLTWGVFAVGAAIAALPSAFLAAGIVRPVSPQFASVCQRIGLLLSRPGVHASDVQAAVSAEMRVHYPQLVQLAADEVLHRTNMKGFSPAELGQAEPQTQREPQVGTSGPNDPDVPTPAPMDAAEAAEAPADAISQDSITLTGGNQ